MPDAVKVGFVPFSTVPKGVLVVFCDDTLKFGPATRKTLGAAPNLVKRAAATNQFKGKSGSTLDILEPEGIKIQRLIVVGAGKPSDLKDRDFLKFGGVLAGKLNSGSEAVTIMAELPDGAMQPGQAAAIGSGLRLRAYRFDRYKTKKKDGEDGGLRAQVSLAAVARAARPGWDHGRPPGIDAGLEETYYYEPPTVTWSYAAHVAAVDVDIELGRVNIEKYIIAHDCGVVVNPMLVEGQIVGGAAQGLGGALLEEFNYDPEGQLLAGSFMDYMVPTACEIPDMQLIHQHSPSPLNPLGVKGVGEGGPIAPPAVIANAVSDALRPFALEFNRTPIKPQIILQAVRSASQPR